MKFFQLLLVAAIIITLVSCTKPPLPRQESDFTKFVFTEYASREIREKNFQPSVFIVESNAPLYSLNKTTATLMFKDVEKDEYFSASYTMRFEGNNPFKEGYVLLRTEKEILIDDYRQKGILFMIKFERTLPTTVFGSDPYTADCIEKMTLFSNVRQAYYEPPPGTTPPDTTQTFRLLTMEEVDAAEKVPLNGLLGADNYKYYKIRVLDAEEGILIFESGRFTKTKSGQSIETVIEYVNQLFDKYNLGDNPDIKIFVTGHASSLNFKPVKQDSAYFENERVFFKDKDSIKEGQPFTRTDMNYTNNELPVLRALEVKHALVRRFTGKFPNIDDSIYGTYQKPEGDDKDDWTRRIDIVIAVPIEK